MKPKVNYGLWVSMMCQYMFINYNKCITLVGDTDNGGRHARVWVGCYGKLTANLKLPLKKSLGKNVHLKKMEPFLPSFSIFSKNLYMIGTLSF